MSLNLAYLLLHATLSTAEPPQQALVLWRDQVDLSAAPQWSDRPGQVWNRLTEQSRVQRERLLGLGKTAGVDVLRQYTVVNATLVSGSQAALQKLARRGDVRAVLPNQIWRNRLPETTPAPASKAVEASLNQIRVPQVWALGFAGQGVTVASADTGVQWNHPALVQQYRGSDAGGVSHGYHWHDAIHTAASSCGASAAAPCDDNSHGSHTVGTMVGAAGSNQIGVAPQARWIACRNMEAGAGTPATYLECMDWMLAPTDASGANPRPELAPDIINNSWGCPPEEGCTPEQSALLELAVNNLNAAGILFVAAAGNSGSGCGSISDPPAYFTRSLTVGNGRSDNTINASSSRGPVTVDASNRLKPDLSAPGTSIRSTLNNGGYGVKTGTSMAAPHIAGVAALILSARPDLRRNPEQLTAVLKQTATLMSVSQTCGGIAPTTYPNPIVGHGMVDALAAVQAALALPSVSVYADGFED